MPLTKERFLTVLDAASAYEQKIKTMLEIIKAARRNYADTIATDMTSMSNEELAKHCDRTLENIEDIIVRHIPLEARDALTAERTHFNFSARRNDAARIGMANMRRRRRGEFYVPNQEPDLELDQDEPIVYFKPDPARDAEVLARLHAEENQAGQAQEEKPGAATDYLANREPASPYKIQLPRKPSNGDQS